jgi:hypothetical protein
MSWCTVPQKTTPKAGVEPASLLITILPLRRPATAYGRQSGTNMTENVSSVFTARPLERVLVDWRRHGSIHEA